MLILEVWKRRRGEETSKDVCYILLWAGLHTAKVHSSGLLERGGEYLYSVEFFCDKVRFLNLE